ncbi:MAG TPA: FHA domain-containing protein [Vicinamibacterales bacterium]|nr:FHA domain-containing protein [Vicinamibacterales bacterium]
MFILLYTRDGRTCQHPLTTGDTVVGRAPSCDLQIDDPSISRRHVRFRVHGDRCVLADVGGRNGTFVNGDQVTECELSAGDTIVLGRFPLRLDQAAAAPIVLSGAHSLIQAGSSIVRRVDGGADTQPGTQASFVRDRLLLLVSEIGRQPAGHPAPPDLFESIVSLAFRTMPIDRVCLLLPIEGTSDLSPHVVRTRDGRSAAQPSLNREIVRRSMEERLAMLAYDAPRLDVDGGGPPIAAHVRSFICAPLWTGERAIGVLYADNPGGAPLSADDLDVLQALASYAGSALAAASPPSKKEGGQ